MIVQDGFAWFLRGLHGRVTQVRFGIICNRPTPACKPLIDRLHNALQHFAQVAFKVALKASDLVPSGGTLPDKLEHPVELLVTTRYPVSKEKDGVLYSARESFVEVPDVREWDAERDEEVFDRLANKTSAF